ncbi:protein FAM169B [Pteropus alecto]|uniref:protein FAM169B n=1 Tax=Pteropus alecto TaxID=9402 RepID=UPI0007685CB2|nr:protein FAM169B [Pteropus alecto]
MPRDAGTDRTAGGGYSDHSTQTITRKMGRGEVGELQLDVTRQALPLDGLHPGQTANLSERLQSGDDNVGSSGLQEKFRVLLCIRWQQLELRRGPGQPDWDSTEKVRFFKKQAADTRELWKALSWPDGSAWIPLSRPPGARSGLAGQTVEPGGPGRAEFFVGASRPSTSRQEKQYQDDRRVVPGSLREGCRGAKFNFSVGRDLTNTGPAPKSATGTYPVDILEDDPEGHQEEALAYYAALGQGARPSTEVFSLPTGEQVQLDASSVRFCSMHRDEPRHQTLVLVNPQDTKTAVAVYIKGSWWSTEDVLRTSDPAREGLVKVQSFGERIVLFVLNVVIFGRSERKLDDDDMFFLPHSAEEQAKILWRDGAAVGFYTTKMKGSLCGDGTGACYLLPVLDTVFVRRRHRRQGLGVAMLQDFCETFREDEALGISWPVSPAMYQVCRRFLRARPEERGRLWEVEPPGAWDQRSSIWLKVQLQQSRLPNCPASLQERGRE